MSGQIVYVYYDQYGRKYVRVSQMQMVGQTSEGVGESLAYGTAATAIMMAFGAFTFVLSAFLAP